MSSSRTFDPDDHNINAEYQRRKPENSQETEPDIIAIKKVLDERNKVQYALKLDQDGKVIPNTYIAVWYQHVRLEVIDSKQFNRLLYREIETSLKRSDRSHYKKDTTPMKVSYYDYDNGDQPATHLDIEIEFNFPDLKDNKILTTFLSNFEHVMTTDFDSNKLYQFEADVTKHKCQNIRSAMTFDRPKTCSPEYAVFNSIRLSLELSRVCRVAEAKQEKYGENIEYPRDLMNARINRVINKLKCDTASLPSKALSDVLFNYYTLKVKELKLNNANDTDDTDVFYCEYDINISPSLVPPPPSNYQLVASLLTSPAGHTLCGYFCIDTERVFDSNGKDQQCEWTGGTTQVENIFKTLWSSSLSSESESYDSSSIDRKIECLMIYVKISEDAKFDVDSCVITDVEAAGDCFFLSVAQCLLQSKSTVIYKCVDPAAKDRHRVIPTTQELRAVVKCLRAAVGSLIRNNDEFAQTMIQDAMDLHEIMKGQEQDIGEGNMGVAEPDTALSKVNWKTGIQQGIQQLADIVTDVKQKKPFANSIEFNLLSKLFAAEGLLIINQTSDYLEKKTANAIASDIALKLKASDEIIENILIVVGNNTHYKFVELFGHTVMNARAVLKKLREIGDRPLTVTYVEYKVPVP